MYKISYCHIFTFSFWLGDYTKEAKVVPGRLPSCILLWARSTGERGGDHSCSIPRPSPERGFSQLWSSSLEGTAAPTDSLCHPFLVVLDLSGCLSGESSCRCTWGPYLSPPRGVECPGGRRPRATTWTLLDLSRSCLPCSGLFSVVGIYSREHRPQLPASAGPAPQPIMLTVPEHFFQGPSSPASRSVWTQIAVQKFSGSFFTFKKPKLEM